MDGKYWTTWIQVKTSRHDLHVLASSETRSTETVESASTDERRKLLL